VGWPEQRVKYISMASLDLKSLTTTEVYEMLMEYTNRYTRMMNTGIRGKEFKECEEIILRLQEEIKNRQKVTGK
jgi:hypothetical protein